MGNGRGKRKFPQSPVPSPQSPMNAPLHVETRAGEGVALVFVHAFGASARTWHGVADALGGAFPCVMPDLRGWGGSGAPTAGQTVAAMADDVEALAGPLGRWALVGHSMGGKVALALAARRPAGLTHLVLVAPSPPGPEPMGDADRERLRAAWGRRAACERIVRDVTARPLPREAFEAAVADHLRASRTAWTAWLDGGSREDLAADAARVAVPTLIVAGSADVALGADVQARETVARIDGARLVTVPHAGHFVPLDAPEALAGLVRTHVAG